MVTVHLMGSMGTEPILSVKRSVSIDTMINFDSDADGDGTCKQAFTPGPACKEFGYYEHPAIVSNFFISEKNISGLPYYLKSSVTRSTML